MGISIAIALLGTVLMTGPAMADLTITATQQGKGMMSKFMTGEAVTRIKGGKMRGDSSSSDGATSTLIDLDARGWPSSITRRRKRPSPTSASSRPPWGR